MITTLGSIGIGLVWGWLFASVEGRILYPLRAVPILFIASLLIGGEVLAFGDVEQLLLFFVSTAFALLIHLGWRHELRRRSK